MLFRKNDEELQQKVIALTQRDREWSGAYTALEKKHKMLVETVDQLTKHMDIPIDTIMKIPHEHNSFIMIASKKDMILLPNGHKGYQIRHLHFLVDSAIYRTICWIAAICESTSYLTTEGGIAHLYGERRLTESKRDWKRDYNSPHLGKLLLEVIPDKETRIYPALKEVVRENNKAILKVTFPEQKEITEEDVRSILGISQRQVHDDPVVEVIFE